MRFFFYSHDGLGLGHTRRNLAITAALAELAPEAPILLATGTEEVHRLGVPPGVEILKLPGLRKVTNGCYAARRLRITEPDILAVRSAILKAAVQSFRPTVMLVDKHPFGASGELRAALERLRAAGGRTALGLRDVLDDRATVLSEWAPYNIQAKVAEYYDRVLVYGHRAVFDPLAEYGFPPSVAERTLFCGYVVSRSEPTGSADHQLPLFLRQEHQRPVVLATAGGGEDGFDLLEAFIQAASGAPWEGVVVAGPFVPEGHCETLRRLAAAVGMTFRTFVPGLNSQFGLVDVLVCMGGYNTLAEAVAIGTPTVCVPRTLPRREQLIRTQAFSRLGLVRLIEPHELAVGRLRMEIETALRSSRQQLHEQAHARLRFDGACQAATALLELAATAKRPTMVQVGRLPS